MQKTGIQTKYRATLAVLCMLSIFAGQCAASQPVQKTNEKTEVKAEVKPKPVKVTRYIDANGGLRMRKEPHLKADRITTIPNGTKVEVLKTSGETITISEKTGKWSQVNFNGTNGWVFGGFLSSANRVAAGLYSKIPDYDSGTAFTAKYWSDLCLGMNAPKKCQLPIKITKDKDHKAGGFKIYIHFDAGHGLYSIAPVSIVADQGSYQLTGMVNDLKKPVKLSFQFTGESSLKLQAQDPNDYMELKKMNRTFRKSKG